MRINYHMTFSRGRIVHGALYIAWLCLAACSDRRGTEPSSPMLEETAEYWSNGYLRSVYQHYTNARGHTVLHGSYRTYSERAQNLL